MTLKKLSESLAGARSGKDFFHALCWFAERNPRYGLELEDGSARRFVLFGDPYTNRVARIILESPNASRYFASIRELRIVATKITKEIAREFKKLNPSMRISWMSADEWDERPPGSPDPVSLSEEAPPDADHTL